MRLSKKLLVLTVSIFALSFGLNTASAQTLSVAEEIYLLADSGDYPEILPLIDQVPTSGSGFSEARTAFLYALSQMSINCKTWTKGAGIAQWNQRWRGDIDSTILGLLQATETRRGCGTDVLG